jgi:hypothetical protein
MVQKAPSIDFPWLLQSRLFQFAISVLLGAAAFLLTSWGLGGHGDTDADGAVAPAQNPPASDSIAPRIPENRVAFASPVFSAQSLLAEVQAGDRVDIVALFPPASRIPVRSAVVVRGATVVARPAATAGAPIVFAVTPEESLVMAHLVQSGIPLTYSLWSGGGPPPVVQPLDLPEVRARLGLE